MLVALGGVRLTTMVLLGYGHTVMVPVSCFGHLGVDLLAPSPSCPPLPVPPLPGPPLPVPPVSRAPLPGKRLPASPGWLLLDRGGSVLHDGVAVNVKLTNALEEWAALVLLGTGDSDFDG